MRVKRPILLVACVLTAACGSGEVDGDRFAVVDSTGVEIVESARPAWDAGDAWRMSDEPTLSIGARKGKAPYLFNGAVSGRRLGDGRIVVADRGSSQLRFFDPAGRFLSSAGGEGDGPGEFRYIVRLWTLPGDTLAVTDNRRGLSLFDPQGAYIRSLGHLGEQAAWQGQPVGQLDDGTILAHAGSGFSPRAGEVAPTTVRLLRAAPGDSARELRTIPQARIWGFQMANFNSAMPRGIPFSSAPAFAAAGEHFYVADGPDPEVRVWRGDGSLRRIMRWSMAPRTVDEELVERYREHLAGSTDDPEARRRNDAFLAEVQLPERVPATDGGAMLVDGEGNLWVPAYSLPWAEAPAWDVFSPEGAWLGPVSMPPRFTPWQIGRDFVLGSWQDELDVEYVLVYELVKAALRI